MYQDVYDVVRGFETIEHIFKLVYVADWAIPSGYIGGSYPAFMMGFSLGIGRKEYNIVLPNDVDIFATSREKAESIMDKLEGIDYQIQSASDHVWTLEHKEHIGVQVIEPKPEWMDVTASFTSLLLNDFDLSSSRAVLLDSGHVLADCDVPYRSSKILRINNPLRTLKRVLKYHARGCEFADQELIKLFQCWDQLSDERKTELISANQYPEEEFPDSYSDDWFDEDDWFEGE